MDAIETIRALEREAFELARLARALKADVDALRHRIHAEWCADSRCVDGWIVTRAEDGSSVLAECEALPAPAHSCPGCAHPKHVALRCHEITAFSQKPCACDLHFGLWPDNEEYPDYLITRVPATR